MFLLLVECTLSLQSCFTTLSLIDLESTRRAFEVTERLVPQSNSFVNNAIQEHLVMRCQDDSPRLFNQVLLQPERSIEILDSQ